MGDSRTVGIMLGVVIAVVGLASTIVCALNYGIDSPVTMVFGTIFVVGLLIACIVGSQ
jgi:hypothetical protein